ncbi:YgzB family protein [Bacillaceae bacterium S4-13-58]
MAKEGYTNKINRIRTFALSLIFIGMGVMYLGIIAKKIEWLMVILMIIGMLFIVFSTLVYFWIGMLSTRTIQVTCPSCGKPTKMLGRVDACMHCRQPLTRDKELEGKELDEKYNSKKYSEDQKN